jgi:hypothetical protein
MSVVQLAVHQRSLLQSPVPPSGAVQALQGDVVLDEQGSPTWPLVPAQMLFDPALEVIG